MNYFHLLQFFLRLDLDQRSLWSGKIKEESNRVPCPSKIEKQFERWNSNLVAFIVYFALVN